MQKTQKSPHPEESILRPLAEGWRVILRLPAATRLGLVLLLFLTVLMFPAGRGGADDAGGLLAPVTADSGSRHLFRMRPAADFFSVYDAGARVLQGRDPYGVNEDTGHEGVRAPWVATFRYLPVTAFWLAVPLNALPPWPAFYLWAGFNLSLLAANFLMCLARRPDCPLVLGLLWFAFFPVIAELHMGQFTLFMATLMLWGIDAMARGRSVGVLGWGMACLLKVYPFAMAPSLFLWGWRRSAAVFLAVAAGTTLLWQAAVPSAMDEGLVRRGVAGRMVGELRVPYAGAMGVQAMTNAIIWKASGRSLDPNREFVAPTVDPALIANAIVLLVFAGLCAWAFWSSRRRFSLPALGLFWLVWFYAYVDCWEHHYVLVQALVGLLLIWSVISPRLALVCWASAGGPSLWWLWERTGYAGNMLAETIGTLYFLQRPMAVFVLTIALTIALARETAKLRSDPAP